MKSRRKIADVIQKIASAKPKTIILDILFPNNSETGAGDDQYLSETIAACPAVYTAVRIADQRIERSFFAKQSNEKEGLINDNSHFCPYAVFENDTLAYMEYAVSGVNGKPDLNRLINYSDREFDILTDNDSLFAEAIDGQIVIVGDLEDWRDMHDLPFRINAQWRAPGTTLLAYRLSTVLNNNWVIRLPQYISWFIALILTFVFALFCDWLKTKLSNDALRNLIQLAVWTILIISLLLISYIIFSQCGKIISPVYAGSALSLTGFARDGWEIICLSYNRMLKYKQNETNTF
jgi:CHASE2 domain-containing sensor protein